MKRRLFIRLESPDQDFTVAEMECPACNQDMKYTHIATLNGIVYDLYECKHHGTTSIRR